MAVFGANNHLFNTMGSMQLRSIIKGEFNGKIYPIHLKLDTVQGMKAYKSVLDLPETPDLAFIILPPRVIAQVIEECAQKGIKRIIITSGGFREKGSKGKDLSHQVKEIATKYNMKIVGPNCLGVFNSWYQPEIEDSYFNTMWVPEIPKRGYISIASQSGTIATHGFGHCKEMGVNIGKSISAGNELTTDLVDYLEFFKLDPYTKVIGLYIEEIKRGQRFKETAKKISPLKPIVAIYAGGTEAASRSIMSHTGSIGGNQKIFDVVFKETGIIPTDSMTEFLYYLRTLSFAMENNVFMKGNRVGIVTNSGGAGSMMVKTTELNGLEVPEFSKNLQEKLNTTLPYTADSRNPIDLTFDPNMFNIYKKYPKMLMDSGEVDAIIVYGVFDFHSTLEQMKSMGINVEKESKNMDIMLEQSVLKPMIRLMRKHSIPVFYVGPMPYRYHTLQKFINYNIPIFDLWDIPTKALKVLYEYSKFRELKKS